MRASEIMEQVGTIQQQARALVGQTNALLRSLEPLVREEQNETPERPRPRVFGQRAKEKEDAEKEQAAK